jgi:serine/threonine protein phosphatase PrpC
MIALRSEGFLWFIHALHQERSSPHSRQIVGAVMSDRSLRIDAAAGTDRGRRRVRNEDALGVFPDLGLFAVADGVGSRLNGDVASERAIEVVSAFFGADTTWPMEADGKRDDVQAFFVAALKHANEVLRSESQQQPQDFRMATTFAGVLVDKDRVCIAHVGDSRVGRLRDEHLEWLTQDHNMANAFIERGEPEQRARAMPNAKALTRALGLEPSVKVSAQILPLLIGDLFLLCTDGLHGTLPNAEIAAVLVGCEDVGAAVERLVARANERGGPDNITAVLLHAEARGG